MKLSASVPDELWQTVHRPGDSTSAVVQEALRLLHAKRDRSGRSTFPGAVGSEFDTPKGRATLEAEVDRLVGEARQVRTLGYQVGADTATRLRWVYLEQLPAIEQLRSALSEWWAAGDLPIENWSLEWADTNPETPIATFVLETLRDVINESGRAGRGGWGDTLLFVDGRISADSPTFFAGIATALNDVRDAVLDRVQTLELRSTEEPERAGLALVPEETE